MTSEFRNEPFSDFSRPKAKRAFAKALDEVRGTFGRTYPLWIGGREVQATETFTSTDPAQPDVVLGRFQKGTAAHVDQAVAAAASAFATWQHTPAETRAAVLLKAAALMRERKHWFSAWLVFEVGKSWAEADGDTAEAIDFMDAWTRVFPPFPKGSAYPTPDGLSRP